MNLVTDGFGLIDSTTDVLLKGFSVGESPCGGPCLVALDDLFPTIFCCAAPPVGEPLCGGLCLVALDDLFPTIFCCGAAPPSVSFEEGFVAFLAANLDGIPVWLGRVPQRASLPAIVYQSVSADHEAVLGGPARLAWRRVQLSVYSTVALDIVTWSETLRTLLNGYSGSMVGLVVQSCFLHDQRNVDYVPAASGSDRGTYGLLNEYTVWYVES